MPREHVPQNPACEGLRAKTAKCPSRNNVGIPGFAERKAERHALDLIREHRLSKRRSAKILLGELSDVLFGELHSVFGHEFVLDLHQFLQPNVGSEHTEQLVLLVS